MALREFRALVERAGGRQQLLLVGEGPEGAPGAPSPRALLETFARELFGEEGGGGGAAKPGERRPSPSPPPGPRRVRVRVGAPSPASRPGPRACRLLFVLFRAASLLLLPRRARERRRLREILRDVRSRLRPARPAVVGVVVVSSPSPPPAPCPAGPASPPGAPQPGAAAEDAARAQLEALLRQVFRGRRRRRRRGGGGAGQADPWRPGLRDTLQAAAYRPGAAQGAAEAREAACRALRAALKLRADGGETKKQKLPIFLQCLLWGRRRQQRKGHFDTAANKFNEDALQDLEEGVALTNIAPNGNCEEARGGTDT